MTTQNERYAEYGQIALASTSAIYSVCKLYGGQSITIKGLAANTGKAYVGFDRLVSTSTGYEIDAGEVITLTLPATFGRTNFLRINAVTDTGGDNICYIKLIDLEPETSA